MYTKILVITGLVWNISGFSQTNTDLSDSYQPPQTVINQTVRLLPGFHANSKNVVYNNGGQFIAKSENVTGGPVITSPPVVHTLSTNENYVYTRTYLAPVTSSNNYAPQVQSITYFDGLGRPKQNIAIRSTPDAADLVTPVLYDEFGRQRLNYLPVPVSTMNGGKQPTIGDDVNSYYSGLGLGGFAYSEKKLENSPLDRIQEQFGPGDDWRSNNKRVTYDYLTNEDSEVFKFVTSTSWNADATKSGLSLASPGNYYSSSTLYKNKVTDEDGNESYEYKNGQGQTLLVRKMLSSTVSADTYYVYNEYDQLAFVISPKATEMVKSNPSGADLGENGMVLKELSYQYRYDGRNRLVEKKLPGKGWEYMVYDRQDRLVMTQDANQGLAKQWIFTKYDQFGRVAYTGIYTGTKDYGSQARLFEQGEVNKVVNNVARKTPGFTTPGLIVYYDNDSAKNYPNTITRLLSVNYYDSYPTDKPNLYSLGFEQTFITDNFQNSINTKSLPVASYISNIENNSWTKTFTYYDNKGRATGSYSRNHLGGNTQVESFLDFTGTPQKTITRHKRRNSDTEVRIAERFIYDHQNRLKKHYHQIDGRAEVLLAENTYDELGRLDKKQVGDNLQEINYAYNIRGWMTGINNIGAIGNDLFAYKIHYNTLEIPAHIRKPYLADQSLEINKRYNGNISQIDWLIADPSESSHQQKSYGYSYDALNRLKAGFYYLKNSGQYVFTEENNEILKYDFNGNINELKRFSYNIGTASSLIDDLGYQYTGNRLTTIDDFSGDGNGYEGGSSTINYDANGNMIDMLDKGINSIAYNHLNLPNAMDMGSGKRKSSNSILYRADGIKLRKFYTSLRQTMPGIWANVTATTHYLNGFQYYDSGMAGRSIAAEGFAEESEQDFAMEREAFQRVEEVALAEPSVGVDNAVLQFVPTAEGYYSFTENRYIYQYRDHLGNARVSYARNNTGGIDVTDKNNYYPFGMNHLDNNSGAFFGQSSYKNYKYNGKELQETGMYDYGARLYMPDIGRWGVVDPLAEKYFNLSTFNYAANNPILYIDPDGMELDLSDIMKKGNEEQYKAFVFFAKTKEGQAFLSKYMAKGQSITYGGKKIFEAKSNGEFHNNGIDLSFGVRTDSDTGSYTEGSVKDDRVNVNVMVSKKAFGDSGSQFFNTLEHITHESFLHVDLTAKDYKDDGKGNSSSIPKEYRQYDTWLSSHGQHYYIQAEYLKDPANNKVNTFTKEGFKILQQANEALKLKLGDSQIKTQMWTFSGSYLNVSKDGKLVHRDAQKK